MIFAIYGIIAAVALQRLFELALARRNARRLMAEGAIEYGARHYPAIVLLHVSWLAAMVVYVPNPPQLHAIALAAFAVLQALRMWVLLSLGRFFTTRVFTLPEAPLVKTGPYRFMRHPNYAIVAGEILTLPLAFGEVTVAVVFSLVNAGLLGLRIRIEEQALAARRK